MHQSIVIGPAADAVEPRFEQFKFVVAAFLGQIFDKKNARYFFF
jgi:hypothetical protein